LFIRDGELAKVIGRDNKVNKVFTADPSKAIFEGQLNVLIDLGTAGAGEAVAAAVLERKRGEVVGERSFGAGTEQQLFTLRGGDGFLLTVAKWASPSGVPFLGEDRATMGVKPSVEVKRPDTPEALEVEELIDQQDQQNQNPQPNASPTPQPEKAKPAVEDLQLKKALELLQDKAQTAKSGE
jgi:carboxyl-terminal processing protease